MKTLSDCWHRHWQVMSLLSALILAGSALAFAHELDKDSNARSTVAIPALDESPIARQGRPAGSFAAVVKEVVPAVVKIESTATVKNTSMQGVPGFDDPMLRRFFGEPFGPGFPRRGLGPQIQHGMGSGVIVTPDGYILTNNHVVDGAKELKVTLRDGRQFSARIVGRDPKSDVAVVKIDEKGLPVVRLADSDQVEVGDRVLAVGNPFGVGQTVTQGIVSAKNRGNMGIDDYEDFIQTDAAINPGNSGGALVDIEGRLIGINTAILSRSGGSQGVGFAIPSNLARTVMQSLIASGHVERGYLGVTIQDLTQDLKSEFGLKNAHGALVGDVVAGGPASKAGLKPGDVIVEFDGKKVSDSRQLKLAVAETKPGKTAQVMVLRNGGTRTLEVTVQPLKDSEAMAEAKMGSADESGTLNGVGVADLNPQNRDEFNVPKKVQGAIVTEVDPNSASAAAGLKPGDVIEEINRHPVKNAEDAVRMTQKSDDKRTLVRVWERGASRYVVVDESEKAG